MADQIQYQGKNYQHALTLYAIVFNSAGQPWRTDTLAFENYATADRATKYANAMAEQGTASCFYLGATPQIPSGVYYVVVYQQAGGSPAEGDEALGVANLYWTGTAWG